MYRVVVVADQVVHARQVVHALGQEKELQVSEVVTNHGLTDALARVTPAALAEAAVMLFVPAAPVEPPLAGSTEEARRPPLVVHDIDGRVDLLTARELGACGYVGFWEPEALTERVLQVAKGELALPPGTAERLRRTLHTAMRADPRIKRLRVEEVKMMRLVAGGHSLKEAAHALRKSASANYHAMARIRAKMGVDTRASALSLLAEAGLLAGGEEPPPGADGG